MNGTEIGIQARKELCALLEANDAPQGEERAGKAYRWKPEF